MKDTSKLLDLWLCDTIIGIQMDHIGTESFGVTVARGKWE